MTSQIDRLDPEQRTVVRMAAVLGQSFLAEELAALTDEPLPTDSDEFWKEFDSILTVTGPGALRFRHSLVRDAAYEELPYRRRRALHARAGDAHRARRSGDRPEAEAELLSLHYFHANRFDDAWRFARIAATRARSTSTRTSKPPRSSTAPSTRPGAAPTSNAADLAEVWERLGDVTERAGIYDRALQAYRTARRLHGDDAVAAAGLLLKEAWIAERTGRYSEAVRAVRKGLKQLGDADSRRTPSARAAACTPGTRPSARPRAARARRCASAWPRSRARSRSTTPPPRPRPGYILDWAYVSLGQSEQAVHSERALELYTELGDLTGPGGRAQQPRRLRLLRRPVGRGGRALRAGAGAPGAHRQRGRRRDRACTTSARSSSTRATTTRRTTYITEADRVWRASDYRGGIGIAQMQLARLEAARGDFDAALDAPRGRPRGCWWRSTPTPTSWRSTCAPRSACSPPATTAPRAGPSTRRCGATRRSVA